MALGLSSEFIWQLSSFGRSETRIVFVREGFQVILVDEPLMPQFLGSEPS